MAEAAARVQIPVSRTRTSKGRRDTHRRMAVLLPSKVEHFFHHSLRPRTYPFAGALLVLCPRKAWVHLHIQVQVQAHTDRHRHRREKERERAYDCGARGLHIFIV